MLHFAMYRQIPEQNVKNHMFGKCWYKDDTMLYFVEKATKIVSPSLPSIFPIYSQSEYFITVSKIV